MKLYSQEKRSVGNLLLTAILAVIDEGATSRRATGAAHVMFGKGGSPAVLVLDSPHGVLFVGPYDELLHSNLATYIGMGDGEFPWFRHSTSFYHVEPTGAFFEAMFRG